VKSKKNHQRVH